MRRRHSQTVAVAAALAAAVFAGYALRPPTRPAVNVASRDPAVEVRTVVTRRTIHIVKHQRSLSPVGPNRGASISRGAGGGPRTHTSGSHLGGASGVAGAAVSTRVSGSHPSAGGSGSVPVTTRTSAHGGSSGTAGSPVTTRTSAASGKRVSTRASGSGGGDGGDGSGDS